MPGAEFDWRVPADHPALAGHFPGRPIVPGVVLLDLAIQYAERWLGQPVARWQVGNAKFFSPAGPEEVLTFVLEARAAGSIAFNVHCAGRAVAAGSLTPPAP